MNGDEELNGNEESDEQGDAQKTKGSKTLVLVQDFENYCIYRGASSYVVYKPNNVFVGYFTTLGSCVRQVYECIIMDKAMKRENHLKKNIESLTHVIEETTTQMKKLTANLDNITFAKTTEKTIKKGKVE